MPAVNAQVRDAQGLQNVSSHQVQHASQLGKDQHAVAFRLLPLAPFLGEPDAQLVQDVPAPAPV